MTPPATRRVDEVADTRNKAVAMQASQDAGQEADTKNPVDGA
jgi:hypothetical protein